MFCAEQLSSLQSLVTAVSKKPLTACSWQFRSRQRTSYIYCHHFWYIPCFEASLFRKWGGMYLPSRGQKKNSITKLWHWHLHRHQPLQHHLLHRKKKSVPQVLKPLTASLNKNPSTFNTSHRGLEQWPQSSCFHLLSCPLKKDIGVCYFFDQVTHAFYGCYSICDESLSSWNWLRLNLVPGYLSSLRFSLCHSNTGTHSITTSIFPSPWM